MKHPLPKIVPLLVVLAVAAAGAMGPDDARSVAQAAHGPEEALIVNPASNPARTTVVGPVTATIANTQPIPVTVQGTPSVAVSGEVTVANTQPIPVRDVNSAPTAWVGGGQILIPAGEEFNSEQFFAPPPGKRLVIEAFTVDLSLPDGQFATQAAILASADGVAELFRFPLLPVPGAVSGHDSFGTAQSTRINVAGGVIVYVSRNATTGLGLANVALSGYLVDE